MFWGKKNIPLSVQKMECMVDAKEALVSCNGNTLVLSRSLELRITRASSASR